MFKKINAKLKEQKGFTLIELLAVIVILGIIAAIAIPAITNVISSSKEKATVADALEVISAAKFYVANNTPAASTFPLDLDYADLDDNLDRVKDNSFNVVVTYNATSKTYLYEIKNHDAVTVVSPGAAAGTAVSEKTLSTWSN
jgi:type IV pilus assembly protein PilA